MKVRSDKSPDIDDSQEAFGMGDGTGESEENDPAADEVAGTAETDLISAVWLDKVSKHRRSLTAPLRAFAPVVRTRSSNTLDAMKISWI